MGNALSNNLHRVCRALEETGIVLTPDQNAWLVNKTYAEYPTSADMLKTVNPRNLFMLLKDTENSSGKNS